MTPFTHSSPRSARQPPPAWMRLSPSDLKVLLHRGKTSFPVFKSSGRGKTLASQLRRSVAISKGHAGLTVARRCKSPCSLLGGQAKSRGQIQPQHLCRPTRAPVVYSTLSAAPRLDPGLSASLESWPKELFLHLGTCK